jgi:hypothetical protein
MQAIDALPPVDLAQLPAGQMQGGNGSILQVSPACDNIGVLYAALPSVGTATIQSM